jgi:hypothetical protein
MNERCQPGPEVVREEDGVVFFERYGDLNDPERSAAYDTDPVTGAKWLDVVFEYKKDKDGKIIEAKIKDENAHRRFLVNRSRLGSKRASAIIDGSLERLSGMKKTKREKKDNLVKPDEDMDLGKFQELLIGLIDEDNWTRDQIRGWKLLTWRSKSTKEPVFKLVADFYGGKTEDYVGTYNEIMAQLNDKLDSLEESSQASEYI